MALDTHLPVAPTVTQEHAELISGFMQLRLRYEQDVASQLPVLAAQQLQIDAQAWRYQLLEHEHIERARAASATHDAAEAELRAQLAATQHELETVTEQLGEARVIIGLQSKEIRALSAGAHEGAARC